MEGQRDKVQNLSDNFPNFSVFLMLLFYLSSTLQMYEELWQERRYFLAANCRFMINGEPYVLLDIPSKYWTCSPTVPPSWICSHVLVSCVDERRRFPLKA